MSGQAGYRRAGFLRCSVRRLPIRRWQVPQAAARRKWRHAKPQVGPKMVGAAEARRARPIAQESASACGADSSTWSRQPRVARDYRPGVGGSMRLVSGGFGREIWWRGGVGPGPTKYIAGL